MWVRAQVNCYASRLRGPTKRRARFRGVGLELNERSAQAILRRVKQFHEMTVRGDALSNLPFADAQFDYVICSLFTHHFVDKEVVRNSS